MSHRDAVGVFSVGLIVQAVSYGATFFLAHLIGVDQAGLELLGTVGLFLLVAATITNVGELRMGIGYVYLTSRGQKPNENMGTYFAGILVSGCASCIFVALISVPLFAALNVHDLSALWLFLTLPVLGTMQNLYTNYHIANGNSTKGQWPFLYRAVIQLVGLVPVAFWFRSIEAIGVVYFVAYLVVCLWSAWKIAPFVERPTAESFKRIMGYSWPLIGSMAFVYLSNNLMPYLVAGYLGTAATALYLAGNGLRIAVFSIPSAVCVPLFPLIAKEYKSQGADAARETSNRAVRYTNYAVAPVASAIAAGAAFVVVLLYGGGYRGAVDITILLMLTSVPLSAYQVLSNVLWAIGKQRLELYVTVVQVGSLTSSFLLIPAFGLIGAGLAMLVSAFVGLGLNLYFAARFGVGIRAGAFTPAVAGAVFLPLFFAPAHLLDIAAVGAVCLLAYVLVTLRLRVVGMVEIRHALGLVPVPARYRAALSRRVEILAGWVIG